MPPKTLLVIEDDPAFRQILKDLLEGAGFRARFEPDGERGLVALRQARPDLVLLDVQLPDSSGLEVCRQIRLDPEFGRVPILMVTVDSEPGQIAGGLKAGADDYVAKPFDPEELLARISALFRRQGAGP